MRKTARYGWIKDSKDPRDLKLKLPSRKVAALPSSVDLRSGCPTVYDQGPLGSCTANAIGAAHQFEQLKQMPLNAFVPSRLFIYFNEREMEGTIEEDSGAMIRDGMKSVANLGVCPESMWPYNINQFTARPGPTCYMDALNHQVVQYMRVDQSLDQTRGCLAAGYPFVFGFAVYKGFESEETATTGIVSMPRWWQSALGGHAVLAVGYDDAKQRFLVRNSWGAGWGLQGYFWMPYAYLVRPNLASDLWTIRMVEEPTETDIHA